MSIHDHTPTPRGRALMWAGVLLGVVFAAAFLTQGFGIFGEHQGGGGEPALLIRQGAKILVPETSGLRKSLVTMPAPTETVSAKFVLPGMVESNPALTAAVLTPLAGRVLELRVGLGDRVGRGQVLAVIDSPDLAQAYDDNDKAADAFALTEKNLDRQQEQLKIGTVSDRDLDQARSDHAQAAAEYQRTQARLKLFGVSADSGQRSRLLTVRAPLAGSITSLSIAAGNMINDATQPMMTIADLSTVWVTALVPEKDIAAVFKDQDADINLTAYPDRVLHGKVAFVADVIEADSRRDKIRIIFANADYALKPNMFATVTLMGPKQARVVLPTSALLMNNDRTSVFVATAPWTFERRTVDLQLDEGSSVAIRSGVSAGEQVVVKGGVLLND